MNKEAVADCVNKDNVQLSPVCVQYKNILSN